MNAYQERVLQSFRRVQGWLAANPEYTAPDAGESAAALAAQLAALNGVVGRVTDHAAQQETQYAQSLLIASDEIALRRELFSHHMGAIAKVARVLRGRVPGVGVLKLPKGNTESAGLIAAAAAMAREAEPFRDVLARNGLPPDFIESLQAAGARLQASLDNRGLARAARCAATRGVEAELAEGRRVVAIVDVVLMRVLRSQPAKMAEWRHVKRVVLKGSAEREAVERAEGPASLVEGSPTLAVDAPTVTPRAA